MQLLMKYQIFLSWKKVEQFKKKKQNIYIYIKLIKISKLTFGIQFMHKYRRHIQIVIRQSIINNRVSILRGFQVILNVSLYVRPLLGEKKISAMKKKEITFEFDLLIVSKNTVFTEVKQGYEKYNANSHFYRKNNALKQISDSSDRRTTVTFADAYITKLFIN